MSQFPNIDPYRWPGWFFAAVTATYVLIAVMVFRNPRKFTRPKCFSGSCISATQLKFSVLLKSGWQKHLLVSSTLEVYNYVVTYYYFNRIYILPFHFVSYKSTKTIVIINVTSYTLFMLNSFLIRYNAYRCIAF